LIEERIEPYWRINEQRIVSAALALRAATAPEAVVEALRLPGERGSAIGETGGVDDDEDFVWHGKPRRRVFAVVRVDPEWLKAEPPGEWAGEGLDGVTVQSVLPTAEDAQAEARRLNELNRSKGCAYYWFATRYYPEGRSGTRPG
jgi:hypothetical protein